MRRRLVGNVFADADKALFTLYSGSVRSVCQLQHSLLLRARPDHDAARAGAGNVYLFAPAQVMRVRGYYSAGRRRGAQGWIQSQQGVRRIETTRLGRRRHGPHRESVEVSRSGVDSAVQLHVQLLRFVCHAVGSR
jgi:hypothetical protein